MYVCVCVCVCVYIYIYIYIYRERERERAYFDTVWNKVGWLRRILMSIYHTQFPVNEAVFAISCGWEEWQVESKIVVFESSSKNTLN